MKLTHSNFGANRFNNKKVGSEKIHCSQNPVLDSLTAVRASTHILELNPPLVPKTGITRGGLTQR